MSSTFERREAAGKVLLDDTWPLHTSSGARGRGGFAARLNDGVGDFFDHVLPPEEVGRLTRELGRRRLRPGDVCVVPFMSAACVFEALLECEPLGVLLLPMPLSRHPFWTLMPPCAGSDEVLAGYEETADAFMAILERVVRSPAVRRLVFCDSNSATGKDYVMVRDLVAELSGGRVECTFIVLCNETTEDSLEVGPGYRGGPKLACPVDWGLRVMGSNVKYASHLYTLFKYSADELEEIADGFMGRHPHLFSFWNDARVRKYSSHGYGPLGRGAEWKSRLRFAMGEERLGSLRMDVGALDALRGGLTLNAAFIEKVFPPNPERRWSERLEALAARVLAPAQG